LFTLFLLLFSKPTFKIDKNRLVIFGTWLILLAVSVNLSLLKKFTNCYGVKWVDLAPKTHWRGSKNKQVCKLFSPIFIWFYLRKSLANSLVHFEYTYISLSKHFAYIFVRTNMIITENKQWINKDSEIKGCKT